MDRHNDGSAGAVGYVYVRMGRWCRNSDGAYVPQTQPIIKSITTISTYELPVKET